MTDRALTEKEVDVLERLAMQYDSLPRYLSKPCVDLCASHRLLQQRVKELETTIGWYEAKHPND